MSLALQAGTLALNLGFQTQFLATGGVPPYTYSVIPGGAGGTINPSTGVYTAPNAYSPNVDTVSVVDSLLGPSATLTIRSGPPLILLLDILQNQMALGDGRIFLWDQKIFRPKDNNLWITVSQISVKPFGSSNNQVANGGGLQSVQSLNVQSMIDIDLVSRGTDAIFRKEEVVMAFSSNYSESQQELNNFYVAPLSIGFRDLSELDGTAMIYRYNISVNMIYLASKVQQVPYYDSFPTSQVITNA